MSKIKYDTRYLRSSTRSQSWVGPCGGLGLAEWRDNFKPVNWFINLNKINAKLFFLGKSLLKLHSNFNRN